MDAARLGHRVGTPGLELLTLVLGSSKPVSRPIRGPMSSAATPTAAEQQHAAPRRRRQTKPPVTRRSAIQLLVGVLIVGAIPIVSTVRILQANALRNEQARADSALSDQLQNGLRELGRLGDNASTTAHDLAGSPVVQRAVITRDTATLRRVAGHTPGLAIYLGSKRVAGGNPGPGVQRSIWLTVNGVRAAKIVASVPLGPRLSARLSHDAPHGPRRQARPGEARPRARRRGLHDEGSNRPAGRRRLPRPAGTGAGRERHPPDRAPAQARDRRERRSVPGPRALRGAGIVLAADPGRVPVRRSDHAPHGRLPAGGLAGHDRQPHRPREPAHARRGARARVAPRRPRRRLARVRPPRPRRLQAGERHPWPPGRRRGPARGRPGAARRCPPGRPRRPVRRRGVRADPPRDRPPRRAQARGAPAGSRSRRRRSSWRTARRCR